MGNTRSEGDGEGVGPRMVSGGTRASKWPGSPNRAQYEAESQWASLSTAPCPLLSMSLKLSHSLVAWGGGA